MLAGDILHPLQNARATSFELELEQLLKRMTLRPGLRDATLELQRGMVRLALARNTTRGQYNLSAVARELGIRRGMLYKLLKSM